MYSIRQSMCYTLGEVSDNKNVIKFKFSAVCMLIIVDETQYKINTVIKSIISAGKELNLMPIA